MPSVLELSGTWEIRPDPMERGRRDRWWTPEGQVPSWPGDAWTPIAVPGAWQSTLGVDAPPVCWYRRTVPRTDLVNLAGGEGRRVWLRFDAVATHLRLWLNGQEAGQDVGDWVPLQFDITDVVNSAIIGGRDVELIARVDRVPTNHPWPGQVWVDGAPVQGGHITKGFHDLLSIHKAGLWQDVRIETTGEVSALPNGVGVIGDSRSGEVTVDVDLARCATSGEAAVRVRDDRGHPVGAASVSLSPGQTHATLKLHIGSPRLWSPDLPTLYTLDVSLRDAAGESETHEIRFGFRRVEAGGADGRRVLLNGRPIFLRGVLEWGHEPRHLAPTPTREELRERFARLRDMGFNLVCLCMWYPPRWFYEVADETGMMLWQEHPVWKSAMGDEHIPEYQRQFRQFFRIDRNHPSIVIVSGSCEHERFNPRLAEWWWSEARRLLPDRLLQIQTAFFEWTDLTKTDLYDEHVYESSGRWVHYLRDLQTAMSEMKTPPKPFIMGETILYTSWPDAKSMLASVPVRKGGLPGGVKGINEGRPWWFPSGLDACARFDEELGSRFGEAVRSRFRDHSDRYHLMGRKFQVEQYRRFPNHAGLVMNHLRDVMVCRCGFMDELDRWRFSPGQTRGWLSDTALLLDTEQQLRAFVADGDAEPLHALMALSNFGPEDFRGEVVVRVDGAESGRLNLESPVGSCIHERVRIPLERAARPTRAMVEARAGRDDIPPNSWGIWALPSPARPAPGIYRLEGPAPDPASLVPEFEERKYSSGWGSPVRTWSALLPNPSELIPEASPLRHGHPVPTDAKAIITHVLTPAVLDFLAGGGRVVHLASRLAGSVPTRFVNMWGQNPLILEDGPLGPGDSEWVLELLDHDLTRCCPRAVPVGEFNLDTEVHPVIRLVYTHDMGDRPRVYDAVFTAHVGGRGGLLVASTLDHSTPAGRYLLDRLVAFAANPASDTRGRLDDGILRAWTAAGSAVAAMTLSRGA